MTPDPEGPERGRTSRNPRRGTLEPIFEPKAVAVVGASDAVGSVGRTIVWNLLSSPFGGTVYPVNPNRSSVLGVKAYPRLAELPEAVDLAVVATPADAVPGVIGECVDAGVGGAIVISSGFREVGLEGLDRERRAAEAAARGRLRIVGPNSLGLMNPRTGLNATIAGAMARPGSVGFLSQSGALCAAVLDWSLREQVGFSAFVSVGSMLDIGWGDLIDHLGDDPKTRSIVIAMESIGDARSFLSSAREVALTKPIIVLKAGRTDAGARAAATHTGALIGGIEVLDAAFRRCGVLRVGSLSELFRMADVLGKQPRPRGPRLTILSNAGGPGAIAADALLDARGTPADPSDETIEALDAALPPDWSGGNPIDILGDADPDRYARAVEIAAKDPQSDGLLVVLAPQAMTDPTRTADRLKDYARLRDRPILACWMGGDQVAAGAGILTRAGIPTFPYPDTAARAFAAMWQSGYNLRGIYETPAEVEPVDDGGAAADRKAADEIVRAARTEGRTLLNEAESKRLLASYGIPTLETAVALDAPSAVAAAGRIGYPVAVKLLSNTIAHKSEVGGVALHLRNAEAVRGAFRAIKGGLDPADFLGVTVQPMAAPEGFELIVGSAVDPMFGPVLMFGTGGRLVEVFGDRALALPPLNTTLARRLMEQTRIHEALKGGRGGVSADLGGLERLLVRFSQLVVEQRWIASVEINPLLAGPDRLVALDARVEVRGPDARLEDLPRPAIRPYPTQYVAPWMLRDGTEAVIRPIRPEDEPALIAFHETLSERSVYARYFQALTLKTRVSHDRLTRICFIDYDREMALVACRRPKAPDAPEILAVGRLSRRHNASEAEFAMLVADPHQGQGLGDELLRRLLRIARDEGLRRLTAEMLRSNRPIQRLCERHGFRLRYDPLDEVVRAEIDLD